MRKILCMILTLGFCLCLAVPAHAADTSFVGSITYKETPSIVDVPVESESGEATGSIAIGTVKDEEGNVSSYVEQQCLVVTPVSTALLAETTPGETTADIPSAVSEETEALIMVYQSLSDGSMTIPYEKFEELNPEDAQDMVILELVSATWVCDEVNCEHNHESAVAEDGVVFEITFDLGVAPDEEVYTMTYKNGQWNPIVSTVNNGDGTVTCVFEHLCPVAFSVKARALQPAETAPAETVPAAETEAPAVQAVAPAAEAETSGSGVTVWVVILVAAAAALVVLLRKKK